MAIAVYRREQNPTIEVPSHKAARWLALILVSGLLARWIVKNKTLQLTTVESWRSIKLRYRPLEGPSVTVVERIHPPGYHTMCLQTYPPVPRTYREKMEQERIWERAYD
jgi:hypothetical protein